MFQSLIGSNGNCNEKFTNPDNDEIDVSIPNRE